MSDVGMELRSVGIPVELGHTLSETFPPVGPTGDPEPQDDPTQAPTEGYERLIREYRRLAAEELDLRSAELFRFVRERGFDAPLVLWDVKFKNIAVPVKGYCPKLPPPGVPSNWVATSCAWERHSKLYELPAPNSHQGRERDLPTTGQISQMTLLSLGWTVQAAETF